MIGLGGSPHPNLTPGCPARMQTISPKSTTLQSPERDGPLADVVEFYRAPAELEGTEWIKRLKLEAPRRNIRSFSPGYRAVRRFLDIFGSLTILFFAWPFMVVAAVLVRLTSPGPVIFRQERTGVNLRSKRSDRRRNPVVTAPATEDRRASADRRAEPAFGKPFVIYKFRTMRNDAEKDGAQLATKNDPRITPVGNFLRHSRIDELPQLFNVLRGEMALVGPRPERPEFIEELSEAIPGYIDRLGIKPGLTGVAQILNGYDTDLESVERKVSFDLLYLQNCCLWNDIKILVRTIGVVVTGRGAH